MKKGFTLVEAMIIVALLGIIMVIALPRFSLNAVVKYRVKGAAQQMVSDLRFTRSLAITTGTDHILVITPASYVYNIYRGSVAPGNQVGETRTLAGSLTLGGDTTFTFQAEGNATVGSGTTISITEGSYLSTLTITIPTGYVNMVGP